MKVKVKVKVKAKAEAGDGNRCSWPIGSMLSPSAHIELRVSSSERVLLAPDHP